MSDNIVHLNQFAGGNLLTADEIERLAKGEARLRYRYDTSGATHLLRLVPEQRERFEQAKKNGYIVTRGKKDHARGSYRKEGQGEVRFFLGTHQPHWLRDPRFAKVPLFISRRRLADYKTLPPAEGVFALDSGGFTELQMHGQWMLSVEQYAEEVTRYINFYGKHLLWVAPQDWMCEPIVLNGGKASRGIVFAGTGLSVEEHQRRTVRNFVQLRKLLGDHVIPVLQGWKLADYWRCQDLYKKAGVKLSDERTVGVGSVCRRQSTEEATTIMTTLAADGLNLHGFGFKKGGVKNCHTLLTSADSTAWSDTARQNPVLLDGHDKPGMNRRTGHKNCANCAEWALLWRDQLLIEISTRRAA